MIIDDILKDAESKMKKAIEAIKSEFSVVRTGRASPSLVDHIKIDYFDTLVPLKQLANISIPQANLIVIQPWDKSCIGQIEKSILAANLGVTPVNDGKVVRVTMPHLSEERREELVKVIAKIAESGRVSIRNTRRDTVELIRQNRKKGAITEDEKFKTQDKIQNLTDKYIVNIEQMLSGKKKEIRQL